MASWPLLIVHPTASVGAVIHPLHPRAVPAANEGASSLSYGQVNPSVTHLKRFSVHLSVPLLPSTSWLDGLKAF
jgi:hypothetical protein